jgi:hypothetical protein
MGIFDFVKHGTEEMRITRPHGSREPLLIHGESSIPLFAQLVVEPEDAVVFANEGRALGVVGPGRHVLHPSKLPFLEGFADAAGRLPLQLVFVRLSPIENARFTAKLDPLSDPCSLAAVSPLLDGVLTVQVVDPVALVEQHLSGGADKPILARRGIIATLDSVRLALDGRRVAVFAGKDLPQRVEARAVRSSQHGGAMACKKCGELGEEGKFCAACGALVTDLDQCVECRAELRPGARFCEACGVRVSAT